MFECLSKKVIKKDVYKELYKYANVLMQIFNNCIAGNFINFAICEYYNDDTFT